MLENYLLSRRILSAKTMIKTKNDAKAYEHHRKISLNLSRSRKISQAYATERTLRIPVLIQSLSTLKSILRGRTKYRLEKEKISSI